MGFLDRMKQAARARPTSEVKTSAAGPVIAWSNVGQPKWTPRRYDNLAEEGFRKNVIAYRCVMQIATACSSVPWLLYDDADQEVDRHPVLDLLTHPNPLQDGVTFLESLYAYLEIAGNAFVEAVRPREDQPPVELYLLRPDRMKIVPGVTGLPQAYQYTLNGQTTTWPADPISGASNILHLKRFHPLDDWYGMAPMEAALLSIDQHNAAGAWNQALLGHGARPSGALVYAPKDGPATLSDDQIQRLREEMGMMYQSHRNAGRPMILEGGLDWKEMSLSPKDMDWLAGRSAAARDIALAFGVPAQMIGIPDAQTYANLAEARMAFYEETVLPNLTRVTAAFDHWLCPMYRDYPRLDFDTDCISALSEKRQAQWDKIQNASFLTRNERREAAGFAPITGGDETGNDDGEPSVANAHYGKFNPNHDELGRFTFGSGGDDGGGTDTSQPDISDTISNVLDSIGNVLNDAFGIPSAQAAENTGDTSSAPASWGLDGTLQKHFDDHGADFGAQTPRDCANRANQFYQQYQTEKLPAVEYDTGEIAVYDPTTNTFGIYNPNGTTATFYKPPDGQAYFDRQIERAVSKGGQIINPMPSGGGGGGFFDPKIDRPGNPWDMENE